MLGIVEQQVALRDRVSLEAQRVGGEELPQIETAGVSLLAQIAPGSERGQGGRHTRLYTPPRMADIRAISRR